MIGTKHMTSKLKQVGSVALILAASGYAFTRLQGPQGVPALLNKYKELRQLEDQNESLRQDIRKRQLRNEDLQKDESIELEIRNRFHMLKPKELEFRFQDVKPAAPPTR